MVVPRIVGLAAVALVFISCSTKEKASEGVITRMPNGQVRKLASSEEATVCATQFCEPNYTYTADFGRRHNPDPQPQPPAPPAPQPAPPPPPIASGDRLDYSRGILKVQGAWRTTQGSRDVIVAVIDSGVDYNHPDLKANILVNEAERAGTPGSDDDGNGYIDDVYGWDFFNNRANAFDDNKHGTHCSGIIAAALNGQGIAGVAPNVRILPVKFLGADGSGATDAAIRAIDYAVARGANILSMSWGGGGRSELLNEAIQRAVQRGVLVVAAAGNDASFNDSTPSFPASYPGVIAVASTDESDQLSPFSNYGPQSVFIAAPGSRIYSTVPNGGYATLSGTSMATPQVSGALALALSVNPSVDRDILKGRLCDTSNRILLNKVKCGRMDVQALVESL